MQEIENQMTASNPSAAENTGAPAIARRVLSTPIIVAAEARLGGVLSLVFVGTLVLALNFAPLRSEQPQSFAGLMLIFIGAAVISVVVLDGRSPSSTSIGPMAVSSIGILIIWVAGMLILNKVRSWTELSFAKAGEAAEASDQMRKLPVKARARGARSFSL